MTIINAEMIWAGYTWNYKYSKDKYYIKLQEKTKAEKKMNRLSYNLGGSTIESNYFTI
ncbi:MULTISPECIES: hypothetical protein [unclassified Dysgonomonas]|uniref:hypothetical protein n=1 Tax=unclassified Dysgonomonas TaxID=2630389 RepID=UPI0025C472AD|nr:MULTISPECIES: hypothetical protein [unclassified Dysgonomonas]MDR2002653.1 hypothetical protein [Prevotella sp.]HMM04734.1 hypothetical protein [Dysgonomonas sp.]